MVFHFPKLKLSHMRKQLHFSQANVGKYYEQALAQRKVMVLDEDLLETFPDSDAVNSALRSLKEIVDRTPGKAAPKRRTMAS